MRCGFITQIYTSFSFDILGSKEYKVYKEYCFFSLGLDVLFCFSITSTLDPKGQKG